MEFCEILRQKALTLDTQPTAGMIALQSALHDYLNFEDRHLIEALPFYAARCFSQQVINTLQEFDNTIDLFCAHSLHETKINSKCIFIGIANKRPTVSVMRYCLEDWMEEKLNLFRLRGCMGSSYLPTMSDEAAEVVYDALTQQEKALKATALFSAAVGWNLTNRFMQLTEELLKKQFADCVNDIRVRQQNVDYYNLNTTYIRADFLG